MYWWSAPAGLESRNFAQGPDEPAPWRKEDDEGEPWRAASVGQWWVQDPGSELQWPGRGAGFPLSSRGQPATKSSVCSG